ncbi:MAG TPA: type II toxin-antitoxin system RelE/ParE family toxin [Pyrinomonadaceae bacterium]|nr:type II toxin-antitoxin system RelE/ParE family toxin [Pyrinomonadaceae bacterium]
MDYQVRLSSSARADIKDIVRYISIEDPDQALRFGKFLTQHVKNLGQFPKRGRVIPEFNDESIREIIVRAYRVVYRLQHDKRLVEIIRFWHAARGIPEITGPN